LVGFVKHQCIVADQRRQERRWRKGCWQGIDDHTCVAIVEECITTVEMKMDISLLQERGGDKGQMSRFHVRSPAAIALAPAAAPATPIMLHSCSLLYIVSVQ